MSYKNIYILLAMFGIGTILWPSSAYCNPIYVYKEKGGSIRFSNQKPPEGVSATVFTAKGLPYSILGPRRSRSFGHKLYTQEYSDVIQRAAANVRVDEALIRAVIHAESGFNKNAVSNKGARGLMQLMPPVARELGVRNSFDPGQNVWGGCRLLASLLSKYSGDIKLALAAYNAGAGAVDQYGGIPPYQETMEYVRKVMALRTRYANVAKK